MTRRFCSRCGSRLPGHAPSCPRVPEATAASSATTSAGAVPGEPAADQVDPLANDRELQLIRERLLEERTRMKEVVHPISPAKNRRYARAGVPVLAAAVIAIVLFWGPWKSVSNPLAGAAERTTADVPEVAGVRDVRIADEMQSGASGAGALPAPGSPAGEGAPEAELSAAPDPRVGSMAAARGEIRAAIESYARVLESRDVRQLRRVYPELSRADERAWREFFASVGDLDVVLNVETLDVLDVASSTAVVRVSGTYTFLNRTTGRDESSPVEFEATLRKRGDGWLFSSIR
ncbi:hypothetical protein BH23GEM4_BH23GEM4_14560 [soil metagenome]